MRAIADTARRMGRPPLGMKATQVRLPADLRARIEALVGQNQMAKFIREAIENEIYRREKSVNRNQPDSLPNKAKLPRATD